MPFQRGNNHGNRFAPGTSGNPAGKPVGSEHSKTRLRRLASILTTTENPITGEIGEFTALELMDAALIAKAMKGDVAAYREILDRLEGKPIQEQRVAATWSNTAELSELTPEQAAAIAAILNDESSAESDAAC